MDADLPTPVGYHVHQMEEQIAKDQVEKFKGRTCRRLAMYLNTRKRSWFQENMDILQITSTE
ncbi:hypothetical protein E2C01_043684 [Portunus trituberculatus]|uniref:Uncharacterized protein n=1 Tax=Portunus trituberculatus TaxID=210409 RepID=A0A5B7FQ45_PORTR|nr:hypothetical protein [Portunus trituberculatus]